jgi:rRNA maturation endonuclease Nob1
MTMSVPGTPGFRFEYRCPDGHKRAVPDDSEAVPRCPICGKTMVRFDPYAERRRKIREQRSRGDNDT